MRIGIIGAGMVGRAIATRAVAKGHQVMVSNSRDPKTLFTLGLSTGSKAGTPEEAAGFGEVIVVAIPLHAYKAVPVDATAGKIVIDANNYYPGRDGQIPEIDSKQTTTSELLARHLPASRIVKAFSTIPAVCLESGEGPDAGADEVVLPVAGDDVDAKRVVAELQADLGYGTLDIGPLAEGWRIEEGKPAYGKLLDRVSLGRAVAQASR